MQAACGHERTAGGTGVCAVGMPGMAEGRRLRRRGRSALGVEQALGVLTRGEPRAGTFRPHSRFPAATDLTRETPQRAPHQARSTSAVKVAPRLRRSVHISVSASAS